MAKKRTVQTAGHIGDAGSSQSKTKKSGAVKQPKAGHSSKQPKKQSHVKPPKISIPRKKSTRQRRPTLTFAAEDYNPQGLSKYSEAELRKEYSRLRSMARSRMKRLAESEFKESDILRYNRVDKFKTLAEIKDQQELKRLLSDVARFVTSPLSTITGQREYREKILRTLHENGYTFVNESNLKEWGEFMQYLKARYPYHPSETASVLGPAWREFKVLRTQDITSEQVQARFDEWIKQQYPQSLYAYEVVMDGRKSKGRPVPENLKHENR